MDNQNINLCKEWILHSGIQNSEEDKVGGGFNSWYNLQTREYPYVYSEITGYGITALLFLDNISDDQEYVVRAKKAAQWIADYAMDSSGGVRTRFFLNEQNEKEENIYSFASGNIFAFDSGMVLFGLINLYERTSEKQWLILSKKIADFLIDKTQKDDGSLAAVFDSKNGIIPELEDKWSNQSTGFHAKVSMGLVALYQATKEEKYLNAALKLCDYTLTTQDASGRFITDTVKNTTHVHPHSYSAEGLLYVGTVLGEGKYVSAAEKAVIWSLRYVTDEGINELYDPLTDAFNDFQRSDIIAQVLRLAVVMNLKDKREMLENRLKAYQCLNQQQESHGGFFYDSTKTCVNAWCSMFALQAMIGNNNEYQKKGIEKLKLLI